MGPWTISTTSPGVATLTWTNRDGDAWWLEPQAPGALAELLRARLAEGLHRIEAQVPRDAIDLRRALQRAGLRPEGVARGAHRTAEGHLVDLTRLARLSGDPCPGTREAFLAMLNATLPTKRVIAQGVIRNDSGQVLLCELIYKRDWDLPGGVVDPLESPAAAVGREVAEETGVQVSVGRLLAIDWLPPYRQWDDAVLLVFDLGVHPELPQRARLQPTEIAGLHWADAAVVQQRCAPYVVRMLAHLDGQQTAYLEDGVPVDLQD